MVNAGAKALKAWNEYKALLEGMGGLDSHSMVVVEIAYKAGFLAGEKEAAATSKMDALDALRYAVEQQNKPVEPEISNLTGLNPSIAVVEETAPEPEKKTRKKRVLKKQIHFRTYDEIKADNVYIMEFLKEKGHTVQLREIINAGNAAGRKWYENSVSGYVKKAMEVYPQIKRVGKGLYRYDA
ncbi:hypothetical protein CPT_Silence48 [Bacillus phage Silence]|nr:hypothetical protein CPT_Silence48 [Bacillus phage Silence]